MVARTREPESSWMRYPVERRRYSTADPEGRGVSVGSGSCWVTRPAYERFEDGVAGVVMRAVAAGHDEPPHRPAHARLDAVDLLQGAVRVLGALDQQRRAAHARGVLLEAPGAERGLEPDVAPAVEGGVGVVVVARHPLAQDPALERRPRLADGRDGVVLDDHVRGQQGDAGDRV